MFYFFPDFRNPYFNSAAGILIAGFFAYLSWTFIESKVVNQKRVVVSFVDSLRIAAWKRAQAALADRNKKARAPSRTAG